MTRHSDVPITQRDGDLTVNGTKRRRTPSFTATGADAGARCAQCGRGVGFVEGGAVISALCNVCVGVTSEADEDIFAQREFARIRTGG